MSIKNNQKKVLIVNPGSTKVKREVFWSDKFEGIGIRIVHSGGLVGPLKINKKVKKEIKKAEIFAPIHNKIALEEIERLEKEFPEQDIWAVFDTDFHQTIPEENYLLPIDQKIAKKFGLRKFGFHGSAVESIVKNLKKKKIICVHLGGGSSVTAVKDGKSIYNSMGLTPLSGIMGKTRSGEIDADIFSILTKNKFSVEKISKMLSYNSGFLGLTGSTDTKKIIEKAKQGSSREKITYEIYLNQISAQIAKSIILLQGCDIITLSGGIGFHNEFIKNDLYQKIKIFGIKKNQIKQVQTNEEKLIFDKIKNK